jgi:hypothetical protein
MKEFYIAQVGMAVGLFLLQHTAIPSDRHGVVKILSIQIKHGFAVVSGVRRIAKEAFNLGSGASLVATPSSNVGFSDVAIQIDRLILATRFGHKKDQQRFAIMLHGALLNRNQTVELPAGA